MEDRTNYYSLSIHPSTINVSYRSLGGSIRSAELSVKPEQFQNNNHGGKISPAAKRKIFRAIDYIVHMASPTRALSNPHGRYFTLRLAFFTLTLSSKQIHSDGTIMRRLINYFVTEMIRKWKVPMYVWRAEKQNNGNIHFHFIVNTFIPWNELRNTWNRIQQVLGYITRYSEAQRLKHKNGFKFDGSQFPKLSYDQQKRNWKKGLKTNWDNPNSTDIHSVQHIGNMKTYLCKEITKSDQIGRLSSRLWGCSHNLSGLTGGQEDVDSGFSDEFAMIMKSKKARVYSDDWYSVFYIDQALLKKLGCVLLLACFDKFLQDHFRARAP